MEKIGTRLRRVPGRLLSTLRARLIALVLLASLPALLLIVYTSVEQRKHDKGDALEETLSIVRQVSKDQRELAHDARTLLNVLEHTLDLNDGPAMSKVFAELVREHGVLSNIAFLNPDGFLFASALPFKAPLYAGDREYFRQSIESLEFTIGNYLIGRLTGIASTAFAYPVVKDGTLKGVLVASMSISTLEENLSAIPLKDGQVISIIDSGGTVLARRPFEEGLVGKNIKGTNLEFLLHQSADEWSAEFRGLDGVERVYTVIRLKLSKNGSIFINSGIPASVVYAKADYLLVRNILTSTLIIAFVLLLALLASEKLVLRSVRELVSVTMELGAGKRKTRAAIDGGSEELNYLARSLNKMADSLEAREQETERHLTRIARLNRIYAVLSGINSTIIRNIDRDELLKEACRIAVEHGQFALAWVALSDDSGQLYPAAWAGHEKEYIDALMDNMSLDAGTKPLALRAFLENREMISRDFEKDVELAPWKDIAARYGYRSVAAFPLRMEGSPVGALSFYSVEPSFFDDEEELRLLLELAADTSLGLEKIEKEKRLEYLSRYDTLTGLVNRFIFEDHLEQAIVRVKHNQRNVAVVMLDVEGFGRINDTLGHSAGDTVLKVLAGYLAASVREGDTVARLGNDNFGVILLDLADRKDAVMVAEKIIGGLPVSVTAGGEEVFMKVYSGIAIHPGDGASTHELIKNTELAMHAAGASSALSAQYYSQEINLKAQERRAIENELRHALERKEFELAYQPIVNVEDRRITGVEALLRWNNGKLGRVSPDRFIPVAEETGLIVPIGEWVLKTAVAQAIEWERRGIRGIRIGVNVSVGQIRQSDFCENMERILGYDFGSRAVKLAIEVTESELMKNMEIFINALNKMRRLGLTTYIDDFGTGYSSLSYLKELPIDTLKIDRSFIKDLATDSSSHSMAMGIIAIANSLGLDVVAEGVETEEQLAILNDLGCGSAQGFLFSRPAPAKTIEALIMNRH